MKRIAFYHLETLLCIAEHGTFAAAAEQLNTTQPAISARMRELESQLEFPLFERAGRAMALTVQARQLVRECTPLLASLERSLFAANDFRAASGIVRIGAGEIAAVSCLPPFVTQLNAALPRVSLEIEIDLTANLLQHLLTGKNDMVFLGGPLNVPGLATVPIGSVDLLWLASPAIAGRVEPGFEHLAVWTLPHHSPIHSVAMQAMRKAGGEARSLNSCNNVQTMIDIVANGAGIGLFPHSMVASRLADGSLVQILAHEPISSIHFVAAIRANERSPVVREAFRRVSGLQITERHALPSPGGRDR